MTTSQSQLDIECIPSLGCILSSFSVEETDCSENSQIPIIPENDDLKGRCENRNQLKKGMYLEPSLGEGEVGWECSNCRDMIDGNSMSSGKLTTTHFPSHMPRWILYCCHITEATPMSVWKHPNLKFTNFLVGDKNVGFPKVIFKSWGFSWDVVLILEV